MQSIDHLIDAVATHISESCNQNAIFYSSKIDLKYAYSQIPLETELQKHCNFNILDGKATGTYRFLNGFYGLTDMPATFQKTIDVTLQKCHNKFAFLDDILVITTGNISNHEKNRQNIIPIGQRKPSNKTAKMWNRKERNNLARVPNNTYWYNSNKKKCDSIN